MDNNSKITKKYLIISPHGNVGSNTSFHGKSRIGYTTNIEQARVFTHEEVSAKIFNNSMRYEAQQEAPVCTDYIRDPVLKVDTQYLELTQTMDFNLSPSNEYVIVDHKGGHDGNDVAFISLINDVNEIINTFNYSKALVLTKQTITNLKAGGLLKNHDLYPKEYVDQIARKTFPCDRLDLTTMTINAGFPNFNISNKADK